MIQGQKIEIGGKDYMLPPLGLGGLKKTAELREDYDDMSEDEKLDALIEMVHAALVRNYPDYTLEEMKADLHAHEITALHEAMPALFQKSGLKRRGEARRGSKAK